MEDIITLYSAKQHIYYILSVLPLYRAPAYIRNLQQNTNNNNNINTKPHADLLINMIYNQRFIVVPTGLPKISTLIA